MPNPSSLSAWVDRIYFATIFPAPSFVPAIGPNMTQQFSATGGSGAGYVWSVNGGGSLPSGGSITSGGLYTCGVTTGVIDVVKVTDSFLNTSTVNITVKRDPKTILGSNLSLWLRPDAGFTLVGQNVSALNDQSGSGDSNRNAAQGTAGRRPVYIANDSNANHQPTISYAFTTDYASMATGTWSATLSQPYAVYLASTCDVSHSGNQRLWTSNNSDLDNYIAAGAGNHYFASSVDSLTVIVGNVMTFFGALYNGASSKTYVNAKTATATGNNGTATLGNHGMTIGDYGASVDVAYGLTGNMGEIVVANVAPTTQQHSDLADWFGAKYGITIGA